MSRSSKAQAAVVSPSPAIAQSNTDSAVVESAVSAVAPIAIASAGTINQPSGDTTLPPPLLSDGGSSSQSSASKRAQSPGEPVTSPKRITMVRNTVNVAISEWLLKCPEPSAAGTGGSGNSFVVVIEQFPTVIVITKKDSRKVSKKTIVLGDDSGKFVDLTIWGNFAARSWMYPEGSILLIKNLKFTGSYKGQLQLAFADPDPNHEMLISRADESLDITKKLKKWSVD